MRGEAARLPGSCPLSRISAKISPDPYGFLPGLRRQRLSSFRRGWCPRLATKREYIPICYAGLGNAVPTKRSSPPAVKWARCTGGGFPSQGEKPKNPVTQVLSRFSGRCLAGARRRRAATGKFCGMTRAEHQKIAAAKHARRRAKKPQNRALRHAKGGTKGRRQTQTPKSKKAGARPAFSTLGA